MSSKEKYLLDTGVLVLLKKGSAKISEEWKAKVAGGRHYISAASFGEISKFQNNDIIEDKYRRDDLIDILQEGCDVIPIDAKISREAIELPDYTLEGDEIDRQIIATARTKRLTILTMDKRISKYKKVSAINISEI